MFTVSRSLARRLRVVFKRGLGISSRRSAPDIQIRHDRAGLSISIIGQDAAVSYHQSAPGDALPSDALPSDAVAFSVPFEILNRCEGAHDEPVSIGSQGEAIVAQWTDAGVPQMARSPIGEFQAPLPIPEMIQASDSDELLRALRSAVETTDREASRYALHCIRLRGSDGQVTGTDGRQLFAQDGFAFPWQGELIVPACRVFTCADLSTGGPVSVGRTEAWVVIRSGPWTVHLRIEKEGRFPNVDACIPRPAQTQTTLRLSRSDAAYIGKALRRIPSSDEVNSPVTVDLNGSVSIRSQGHQQPMPTELVLTGSRREGDSLRFNTNRDYLSRAVQLGFRDVEFSGPESPACCRQGRRVYVWSLLGKEGAVLPHPDALRIESPVESESSDHSPHRSPRRLGSPADRSGRTTETGLLQSLSELTETAGALQKGLREVLGKARDIITALEQSLPAARSLDS